MYNLITFIFSIFLHIFIIEKWHEGKKTSAILNIFRVILESNACNIHTFRIFLFFKSFRTLEVL